MRGLGQPQVQRVLVRGTEKTEDDDVALRVPNALLCVAEKRPIVNRKSHSPTAIAFATSDFPSVFLGFLHAEQEYITPASQNAHNIGIS